MVPNFSKLSLLKISILRIILLFTHSSDSWSLKFRFQNFLVSLLPKKKKDLCWSAKSLTLKGSPFQHHKICLKNPSFPRVAAWINADTGIGPSIASGSQICPKKKIWGLKSQLYPQKKIKKSLSKSNFSLQPFLLSHCSVHVVLLNPLCLTSHKISLIDFPCFASNFFFKSFTSKLLLKHIFPSLIGLKKNTFFSNILFRKTVFFGTAEIWPD